MSDVIDTMKVLGVDDGEKLPPLGRDIAFARHPRRFADNRLADDQEVEGVILRIAAMVKAMADKDNISVGVHEFLTFSMPFVYFSHHHLLAITREVTRAGGRIISSTLPTIVIKVAGDKKAKVNDKTLEVTLLVAMGQSRILNYDPTTFVDSDDSYDADSVGSDDSCYDADSNGSDTEKVAVE